MKDLRDKGFWSEDYEYYPIKGILKKKILLYTNEVYLILRIVFFIRVLCKCLTTFPDFSR